jgi:hypothetical protein
MLRQDQQLAQRSMPHPSRVDGVSMMNWVPIPFVYGSRPPLQMPPLSLGLLTNRVNSSPALVPKTETIKIVATPTSLRMIQYIANCSRRLGLDFSINGIRFSCSAEIYLETVSHFPVFLMLFVAEFWSQFNSESTFYNDSISV